MMCHLLAWSKSKLMTPSNTEEVIGQYELKVKVFGIGKWFRTPYNILTDSCKINSIAIK